MVAKLKHRSIVIFALAVVTRGNKASRDSLSLRCDSIAKSSNGAHIDAYIENLMSWVYEADLDSEKKLYDALSCRGGSAPTSQDDGQLDAYIEELIADVDESDNEESLVDDNGSEESEEKPIGDIESEESEENSVNDIENKEPEVKSVHNTESEEEQDDNQDDKQVDKQDVEEEMVLGEATDDEVNKETTEKKPIQRESGNKVEKRYPPPNAVYRFLLNKGIVGRTIVMALILISEFLKAFLPHIAKMLRLLTSLVLGSDARRRRNNEDSMKESLVNDQYTAFTSGSRSGKQNKAIAKKADQIAAEQLRRVGNLQKARYCHVSEDFLRRHKLGPFKTDEDDVLPTAENEEGDEEGEEEEDVDWVVQGLKIEEEKTSRKPSLSIEVSNNGVEVGVDFSIGNPKVSSKRKRKARSSSDRNARLMEAAKAQTALPRSAKKRKAGPRVSDREGGGGVMGRLRNMGANNLVSRSLLGAYPGDALPPLEAASSMGVFDLARKYGYDELSEEDEVVQESPRRKRRRRSTNAFSSSESQKKKSTRTKFEDHSCQTDSFENTVPLTTRRNVKTTSTSPRRRRRSKMVRLPMELMTEKEQTMDLERDRSVTSIESESIAKPSVPLKTRNTNKMVRLPTERTREKALKSDSDKAD